MCMTDAVANKLMSYMGALIRMIYLRLKDG